MTSCADQSVHYGDIHVHDCWSQGRDCKPGMDFCKPQHAIPALFTGAPSKPLVKQWKFPVFNHSLYIHMCMLKTKTPQALHSCRYSLAPNFDGTIFSWISGLAIQSQKFFHKNLERVQLHSGCGFTTRDRENFITIFNVFMKFLDHKTLELYGRFRPC